MECVRADVSSRTAAALADALIRDLLKAHLLSDDFDVQSMTVDKSRMDREKARVKVDASEQTESEGLICVGVDGKDDTKTLSHKVIVDESGERKLKQVTEKEHHLTFTQETGPKRGEYLTHRSVGLKKSGAMLGGVTKGVLVEFKSEETVRAILCDNTATNTGYKTGLVVSLEKEIGRRVHLIGCALHQNELPWKHVFSALDGTTKGPQTLSGPVGKLLQENLEDKPQVKFTPITSRIEELKISDDVIKDLSTDQRLLLEYVKGISAGQVDPKWAAWKIGQYHSARWITMSVRILSVYIRGLYSDDLKEKMYWLVCFIVQVYAVSWFRIKMDNSFKNQPMYIFEMIQDIKMQESQAVRKVALDNLQNNAFGLVPENMLFSMIASENAELRNKAISRILKMRDLNQGEQPALIESDKRIPAINYEAVDWSTLVDLDSIKGNFEPPLTQDISSVDLREAFDTSSALQFPALPAHSQSVERAVKLVSEASAHVYGTEGRHRHILVRLKSRKARPSFGSKGSYSETY